MKNSERNNIEYAISNQESKRLNIIKFISIVFVVYIHMFSENINFLNNNNNLIMPMWLLDIEYSISKVISRIGVPMLFIVSSIFLFKKNRNYGATIKNKIKTLLIPYLIWNSFWIIFMILLQNINFTKPFFSHDPILGSSFYNILSLYGIGNYPQAYQLWFVRDLMIITLIFPIIKKISTKFPKLTLLIGITIMFLNINFPFLNCNRVQLERK